MLVLYFAVVTFISSASAVPTRQKRFDSDPFGMYVGFPFTGGFAGTPYTGAYAGGFAGGPFAGGYAATGFPFAPFMPVPFIRPFPIIPFPEIKPWYKGDNVCVTKNMTTLPQDMPDWVKSAFGPNYDYKQTSENCKGNNNAQICVRRIETPDGGLRVEYILYECCHGFVRNYDGPGCVERSETEGASSESSSSSGSQVKVNDDYHRYEIYNENSHSLSGVEKVPLE